MIDSLVIVRWVHWTACLLLASSQIFRPWLLPKNLLTKESGVAAWRDEFLSRLGALGRSAWAVALLSLVVWFGLTAWALTGSDTGLDLPSIETVATRTQFGRVSLVRLAVLAAAGFCLFRAHAKPVAAPGHPRTADAALTVALSLVNLLALSLTSHGAAAPGPAAVARTLVDAVHLLAASIWPGGLVCFALLLGCTVRARRSTPVMVAAAAATHRFSTFSLAAVGGLSATGLTMSFFFLHQLQDLWTSGYGRLLTAKILAFFGMLAIGAWNLLVLRRKLWRQAQRAHGVPAPAAATARALCRNVLCEIVLSIVVLAMVAALGLTGPPVHQP